MQTTRPRRFYAFTLIEMLTVIAIIGVLSALLFPAINSAREKGRRIACASNLHQIGIGMLAYAGDHQNHVPTALNNAGGSAWYTALTNGYINSTKVFQCPDDKAVPRRNPDGSLRKNPDGTLCAPRSYGIVVGNQTPLAGTPLSDAWIAGSRLTCPLLTNTQVAVVGELYGSVSPIFEDNNNAYIQNVLSGSVTPSSRHVPSNPVAGNYLFLDGHVESVDHPEYRPEMFPVVPSGFTGAPCP